MQYFKDAIGRVHVLDDDIDPATVPAFPVDCVSIDETEADALRAAATPITDLIGVALNDLRSAFDDRATANVIDADGMTWSGGMNSALSIDGAARLGAAAGEASVEIFDASNTGHTLTIEQATAVAAAIGNAYQAVFRRYQEYKVAIAAAADRAALAAAVGAATWA